ncbi:TolC family protein [Flavobacterium sp.]|uniref:TolC family protein n=1 Tax=Flavobacterium sp. TaxID=239 RepID=UPI003D0BEAD2
MSRFINLLLLFPFLIFGQTQELTYTEFLGYVKKFHPLVKQAQLNLSEAQAELMQARGGFDPKFEGDFNQKEYKNKNYYTHFNSSFKIPTWYGVELKASFDTNDGIYLNPETNLPTQGLMAVGVSVPLGQGLLINQRMADIRKAKIAQTLNTAERDLQALEVIVQASISYFNWKRTHQELELYQHYFENAKIRKNGILKLIEQGDKPAIDSVEAGITLRNRELNIEDAKLKLTKARLEVSNFLWTNDNIPLEISEKLVPETNLELSITATLKQEDLTSFKTANHPKIKALQSKLEILEVERKLKANLLLPKLNVSYNYLSEPKYFDNYRFQDYKLALNFAMPLFLRKERGSLKLAQLKIQDTEFKLQFEQLQLQNKLSAQQQEVISINKQLNINKKLVNDFETLLKGEEKLFEIGESSLFLMNTRENALVSSKLSDIALQNRFYNTLISYYQLWGNPNL